MDIADLIPKVIQSIELNRQVKPTIYAELDGGQVKPYPMMHFMGDSRMKAHQLFLAGRVAGLDHRGRSLVETVFTTEVWLTQGQRNLNPGRKPPATIPQKEAVMLAVAANAEPFQTKVQIYEIKRKGHKVEELAFLNENMDPEGLMGLAFTAGWHSRSLSDQQVQELQPRGMRAFLKL